MSNENVARYDTGMGRGFVVMLFTLLACLSCEGPRAEVSGPAASLRVEEVLDRCVTTFTRARTLSAAGVLRDYRTEHRKHDFVRLDLARPDRCRFEMDRLVAIVRGEDWWTYDPATGQFRKHRTFTRTPMETAGYLVSKGVSFLLPAVFVRGEAAFGKSRTLGYRDWRLLGVAWAHERPCYVVGRVAPGQSSETTLRVWIDQDTYLVRGWDVIRPGERGRDETILACMYDELTTNEAIPDEQFSLTGPRMASREGEAISGSGE
jgi:outer membrane lipoprotein-sorting protein